MKSDIEEIKSRLNIVDVLGEYLRLEKSGANWRAKCPFHNEKTPSFMVSEEKQIWHCFGCGKGGDIFGFVMEMEGMEFQEALKMLAEKAGVQLQSYNPRKTQEKNRTLEILELVTKFWEVQLWKGTGKDEILKYLHERGLRDETIKKFRLGYAPKGWRNILNFLIKRGYKIKEIAKTGILVQKNNSADYYDRFRNRIIFPIADYSGKVVGYSARIIPSGDESQAKYINTPETEVYHKSRILYGIDKAKSEIKQQGWVLLMEGNMDVIAAYQAGICNGAAVSGTALTDEQINIIKRYTSRIRMFFDMDNAGEIATKKSVKACLSKEMDIQIINLPFGKDAADMAKDNPEKLKSTVDTPLSVMDYFFQKAFQKFDKEKVEGKKKIAEELLDIIANLENAVEKSHWLKKLSEELETPQTALTDSLKKISLKNRVKENEAYNNQTEPINSADKIDVLTQELIGLMFISPKSWQEMIEKSKSEKVLLKDKLLNLMLEKGQKSKFDFDKFIMALDEDQNLRSKAERIFFQKKYQLDLNNSLKEIIIEEPLEKFRNCFQKIQKEIQKNNLSHLTSDLKLAEKKKDQPAILFLRQEINKISKDLKKLSE